MRLVVTGVDPDRYEYYRDRLLDHVEDWAGDGFDEATGQLIGAVLDFKFGFDRALGGDGRLARWTSDDLRALLVDHLPRGLLLADPQTALDAIRLWLSYLDDHGWFEPGSDTVAVLNTAVTRLAPRFRKRMSDPARFSMGAFWANEMARRGVDQSDEASVRAFGDDLRTGRIDFDQGALAAIVEREETQEADNGFANPQGHVIPVVHAMSDAEADDAAESTAVVRRLRVLVEVLDSGAEFAVDIIDKLAEQDVDDLGARLGIDPAEWTDDQHSAAHPQRVVDVALRARIVRKYKGLLVPVKKNRPLLDAPAWLWSDALLSVPSWAGFEPVGPLGEFNTADLAFPTRDLALIVWTMVYRTGAESGWTEDEMVAMALPQVADHAYGELPSIHGSAPSMLQPSDEKQTRESLARRLRVIRTAMVGIGAAEAAGVPGAPILRATPLGLWGLHRYYRKQGFTAYTDAELAEEPAELLLSLVEETFADESAVRVWVASRTTEAAVRELSAVARRTDDVHHRRLAFDILAAEAGEPGVAEIRARAAAPEHPAPYARAWLVDAGLADAGDLSSEDAVRALLDGLDRLRPAPGQPEPWDAPDGETMSGELRTALSDLPAMLKGAPDGLRRQAAEILQWVADTHPDPKSAKAARKSLFKLES